MEKDKILIVDDDKSVLASLLILFRHHNFDPIIESEPKKILNIIKENDIQAIILDMNFRRGYNEGKEGLHWLESIKNSYPFLNIILITAYGDIDLAVEAVKKGASDFILKPWNNDDLVSKVKKIIKSKKQKEIQKEVFIFKKDIIGESDSINEIKLIADKVSSSPVSILIQGEQGVGKTLLAEYISFNYSKNQIPTVIDVSKEMVITDKVASDVIILNNLESIEDGFNQSLTNFIKQNSNKKIISIIENINDLTNILTDDIIKDLSLIEINIPPLRRRVKDVKPLVFFFLKLYSEKYNRIVKDIDSEALKMLLEHSWYGNVKELDHVIERAVILSDAETITTEELKFDNIEKSSSVNANTTLNLLELEKDAIVKAIEECNGNITKAAKILGITRTALYRRMEKHEL